MKQPIKKQFRPIDFNLRGIFVSTYIPRHCGIATYTKDLTNAINILNPKYLCEIMAIDDPRESVNYPWEVKYRISRDDEKDYLEAASYINKSSSDFVCLQHEFGIFGGHDGGYILNLIRNIKKPLVTTFHTTLLHPSDEQRYIIQKIAERSKIIIVMINESARRLKKNYHVDGDKLVVIPHGVPNIPFSPSHLFKKNIGFSETDFLVGAINLIAPNKGLEYVIEALPEIIKVNPRVKFLMIGETHPLVKAEANESYRKLLLAMIKKNRLGKNFVEVNRYLSLEELTAYLKALDVYITPYLDKNQTSSGTLAYAIGAGKVCVSTRYIYAKETLAKGRGLLVPVQNSAAIAKAIISVINNPKKRAAIEEAAYKHGRHTIWEHVALNYLNLFSYVVSNKK